MDEKNLFSEGHFKQHSAVFPWRTSEFFSSKFFLSSGTKWMTRKKKSGKYLRMHEWVKKKVKWSGLQWFFFHFIFFLSQFHFNFIQRCHLIVNFIHTWARFYRAISLFDLMAFWWCQRFRSERNEILGNFCTLRGQFKRPNKRKLLLKCVRLSGIYDRQMNWKFSDLF